MAAASAGSRLRPIVTSVWAERGVGCWALSGGDVYDMEARSVVVLRLRRDDEGGDAEGRDAPDVTHRDAASAPR